MKTYNDISSVNDSSVKHKIIYALAQDRVPTLSTINKHLTTLDYEKDLPTRQNSHKQKLALRLYKLLIHIKKIDLCVFLTFGTKVRI